MVLKWSGDNPSLIQRLLNDAQLLEFLKDNLKKQVQSLVSFQKCYCSDIWRALHEQPKDQLDKVMEKFEKEIDKLRRDYELQLARLSELSQNIIQLVIILHGDQNSRF
jgi:hypothetical protein